MNTRTSKAREDMNSKTLQYLMGHAYISVTLNVYTHLGLLDAQDELERITKGTKKRSVKNF